MKKLYFYFSILISISSRAQTSVYHPFPDSNVVWNVEYSSQCSTATADRFWKSFVIQGDTMLGAILYRKVYLAWHIEHWQCLGLDFSGPGFYYGAMRQDTVAKTVYYFSDSDTIERLLYNFDIDVGDTLRDFFQSTCWSGDSIITDEDSVYINGNYRKRWKVSLFAGPEYIIEGVGNTSGLFEPICSWFEGGPVLVCCTQNNIVLFQDSLWTSTPGLCGLIDAIPPETKKPEARLYPNPLHDYAILESSNFPASLEIYDLLGIKVYEQVIVSYQTFIQSEDLRNGFYFYLVKNNSSETSSGKFVKE